MCCALAALLGTLVHTEVTRQTVGGAREKALSRLADVTAAYETGEALPPGAGIDPPGLPAPPSPRGQAVHPGAWGSRSSVAKSIRNSPGGS
ncbi:two-component sensor histidine kinase, partial [Streptomyces sp. NPDC001948]